jgi:hypothetical protein
LAGSALLGSYEVIQSRSHSTSLQDHIHASDPHVAQDLRGGASLLSPALADQAIRTAEGSALLKQRLAIQANTLAYNDVSRFVSLIALATAGFLLLRLVMRQYLPPQVTVKGAL